MVTANIRYLFHIFYSNIKLFRQQVDNYSQENKHAAKQTYRAER